MLRLLFAVFLLAAAFPGPAPAEEPLAVVLDIDDAIGPATADYLANGLEKARERNAALVILRMDTPGGLDTAMRDIIRAILASPVPVASYVAPSGARAASAGTYIMYASHVAAMAPGTNLGAATPVQMGGGGPGPEPGGPERAPEDGPQAEDGEEPAGKPAEGKPGLKEKVVNDAAAYIRSLAEMRGRNADWAEKAVREAVSLSAEAALQKRVIDVMATSLDDLLGKVDGRTVTVAQQEREIATAGARIEVIEPTWRNELLAVLTNPNIAYILLMLAFYGLLFEFTNPGAIVPGVVGAISLILALYALQGLPLNYAGLALLLLGIAFMVAEAFVPSFGMLGIGGLVAFVIGSVMLIDTDVPGYGISWPVIVAVSATSGVFFILVIALAVKAHRRKVVSGREEMIGSIGRVVDWGPREGRVRVHSELWRATAPKPLSADREVRVKAVDGLTLLVEPVDEPKEG